MCVAYRLMLDLRNKLSPGRWWSLVFVASCLGCGSITSLAMPIVLEARPVVAELGL